MLFKKTPPGSLVLVLDIQSSSVRASISYFHKEFRPKLVYTDERYIAYRPNTGSAKLLHATELAIKEMIPGIHHFILQGHGVLPASISEAHIILSSPWIISKSKTIIKKFPKKTRITKQLLLDIVEDSRGDDHDQLRTVEEKIFAVRLNGYSVPDWHGKSADELEISCALSSVGSHTVHVFSEACTVIPAQYIHFHSAILLKQIVVRDLVPNRHSYAFVSVHGELTDISYIHNNTPTFIGSFPVGLKSVVRHIIKEGRLTEGVAESVMKLSSHKALTSSHPTPEKNALEKGRDMWLKAFHEIVKSFSGNLPSRILIEGDHSEFFVQSLRHAYPHSHPEIFVCARDVYAPILRSLHN